MPYDDQHHHQPVLICVLFVRLLELSRYLRVRQNFWKFSSLFNLPHEITVELTVEKFYQALLLTCNDVMLLQILQLCL